jgi:hypothetical protein
MHIALVETTPALQVEAHMQQPTSVSVFAGPVSHKHPVLSNRPPVPTPGHYPYDHPDLLELSLPVPVRWAGSLRMTDHPVNHGVSRGSLQTLAPTRTHVHARVPTHIPVTRACVQCLHPLHAGGGEYSAVPALVLQAEHRKVSACALCRAAAAERIEAELVQRSAARPLISVTMRNRPSRPPPPPAYPSPGLPTPHVHTSQGRNSLAQLHAQPTVPAAPASSAPFPRSSLCNHFRSGNGCWSSGCVRVRACV